MKPSRRAKRMTRHHNRRKRSTSLMLVSLMDIFTILVFFLLVNTSTESDPFPDLPYLPDSSAQQSGERTAQIVADGTSIKVNNQIVISDIDTWIQSPRQPPAQTSAQSVQAADEPNPNTSQQIVDPLTAALQALLPTLLPSDNDSSTESATSAGDEEANTDDQEIRRVVTLLADKALPYRVIDKIARSARDAGFNRLAHATKKQGVTTTQGPILGIGETPAANEGSN